MIFLWVGLIGCASTKSSITYFNNPPESIKQCVWAQIEETTKVKLLFIPIAQSKVPFHDQLYYCCPSSKTASGTKGPVCKEALWIKP